MTRRLSMSTWLALALMVVTVVALVVATVVTVARASDLADDVLARRSEALLALQADEAERYLRASERNIATLAATGTVQDAAPRFVDAHRALTPLDPAVVRQSSAAVAAHYRDELLPMLERVADEPVRLRDVLPSDDAALYLQARYTAPDDGVDARERADAGDGSAWSAVHADVHPVLSDMSARLGYADLYLVDPRTSTIVYSADKLPDLATSLEVGPYSGSRLAQAVRAVRADAGTGEVVVTDAGSYGADGGRPTMFVATPVVSDDRLVAVLAGRVSLDQLDRIMTANGAWRRAGFGDGTETFLVGADGTMRSVARGFVEDTDAYLDALRRNGSATPTAIRAMAATDTTATRLRVLNDDEIAAVGTGVTVLPDAPGVLGEQVATVATTLDVQGLDWVVVGQALAEEVAAPVVAFRRATVVAATVTALVVAFVAVAWSREVFRPVRAVGGRLRALRRGDRTSPPRVSPRAAREFVALGGSVERMVTALERRRQEVRDAADERRRVMRAVLPVDVADRVEAGDERVIDHIRQATVVVLTVEGLGVAQRGNGVDDQSVLRRVLDVLDPLARRHGVARVKLLGDAYFAGCGLDRPYLDHAPRTVAFARAAQHAVRALAADMPADPRLSIGIDSGPVTVGLSGSALLVFDMWGDTPNTAHRLAQAAPPGDMLVSERTRTLLPDDVTAVRHEGDGPVAWRVPADAAIEEVPS